MNIDLGVLISAFGGLCAVLLYQAIMFRQVKDGALFKVLTASIVIGLLVAAGIGAYIGLISGIALMDAVVLVGGALLITGLVGFVYILCLFGPCTTSVRIRLLREIGSSEAGVTIKELEGRYNDGVILDLRLARLCGSGDIALQGDSYTIVRSSNMFFLMDRVADLMTAFIVKKN